MPATVDTRGSSPNARRMPPTRTPRRGQGHGHPGKAGRGDAAVGRFAAGVNCSSFRLQLAPVRAIFPGAPRSFLLPPG
ncbi:MAG: hypothetical protein ACLT8E_05810 [Akkermansia sp.]